MFYKTIILLNYKKNIYRKLKYLYKFKKEIFFNVYVNKKKYLNILFNNSISFFKKSLSDYLNYLNWIKKYDLLIHKKYILQNKINLFTNKRLYNDFNKEKTKPFYNFINKNKYVNSYKLNYFYNFTKKFNLFKFTSKENQNNSKIRNNKNNIIIRKEAHESNIIIKLHDNFYNLLMYNLKNKKRLKNNNSNSYFLNKWKYLKPIFKKKYIFNSLFFLIKKIHFKKKSHNKTVNNLILSNEYNELNHIFKKANKLISSLRNHVIYFLNIINLCLSLKKNLFIDTIEKPTDYFKNKSIIDRIIKQLSKHIITSYFFFKSINLIDNKQNKKILLFILRILEYVFNSSISLKNNKQNILYKKISISNLKRALNYLENNLINLIIKKLNNVDIKSNEKYLQNNIYNRIEHFLLKYIKKDTLIDTNTLFSNNLILIETNDFVSNLKTLSKKTYNIYHNYILKIDKKKKFYLSLLSKIKKYNTYKNLEINKPFFFLNNKNFYKIKINNTFLKYNDNYFIKKCNNKIFYKLINSLLYNTNTNFLNLNYKMYNYYKYYNNYFKRHYSYNYYLLNDKSITFNDSNKYFIKRKYELYNNNILLFKKIYSSNYKNIFSIKKLQSPIYYYNNNRRFINLHLYITLKRKEHLYSNNDYNIRFYYKKIYLYYFFKWFNKTFTSHFLSVLFNYIYYIKKERLYLKKRILQYINLNNIGSIVYNKTEKNIFISLVNSNGDVLSSFSSGCIGYFWKKKTNKRTLIKLTRLFLFKIEKILTKHNILYLKIIIKGNLSFIENFFRTMHKRIIIKDRFIMKLKSTIYVLKKYFFIIKKNILKHKKNYLINLNSYIKHLTFFYSLFDYLDISTLNTTSTKIKVPFNVLFMQLKKNKPFIK